MLIDPLCCIICKMVVEDLYHILWSWVMVKKELKKTDS